jgi:hypothetical protein
MAAPDLTAWRKQNSDPLTVDMILTDGSELRATVLVPRGKTLDFVFNVDTAFIEVECLEHGPTVFAVTAIRSVRPAQLPKADQLDRKLKALEKLGNYAVLGIARTATRLQVVEAYQAAKAPYDLDDDVVALLPDEVRAFITSMSRRIGQAALEILSSMPELASLTDVPADAGQQTEAA